MDTVDGLSSFTGSVYLGMIYATGESLSLEANISPTDGWKENAYGRNISSTVSTRNKD